MAGRFRFSDIKYTPDKDIRMAWVAVDGRNRLYLLINPALLLQISNNLPLFGYCHKKIVTSITLC
jgi:hypothetical protein